jgi:hypothetical protein
MTAEKRSKLEAFTSQLEAESRRLLAQRFRRFVSRNRAQASSNGWNKTDVPAWIDEDRKEQRRLW